MVYTWDYDFISESAEHFDLNNDIIDDEDSTNINYINYYSFHILRYIFKSTISNYQVHDVNEKRKNLSKETKYDLFDYGKRLAWEKFIHSICKSIDSNEPRIIANKIIDLVKTLQRETKLPLEIFDMLNILLDDVKSNYHIVDVFNSDSHHIVDEIIKNSKKLVSLLNEPEKKYFRILFNYVKPIKNNHELDEDNLNSFINYNCNAGNKAKETLSAIKSISSRNYDKYQHNIRKHTREVGKYNRIDQRSLHERDIPDHSEFKHQENINLMLYDDHFTRNRKNIISKPDYDNTRLQSISCDLFYEVAEGAKPYDLDNVEICGTDWLRYILKDSSSLDALKIVSDLILLRCNQETRKYLMSVHDVPDAIMSKYKSVLVSLSAESILSSAAHFRLTNVRKVLGVRNGKTAEPYNGLTRIDYDWFVNKLNELPIEQCSDLTKETAINLITKSDNLNELYDDLISMSGFEYHNIVEEIVSYWKDVVKERAYESDSSEDSSIGHKIDKISLLYTGDPITKEDKSDEKYDEKWFNFICLDLPLNGLAENYNELSCIVLDVLKSDSDDYTISETLLNMFGYDNFDTITTILQNRKNVVTNVENNGKKVLSKRTNAKSANSQKPTIASQVIVQTAKEKELQKIIRKEEKKIKTKVGPSKEPEDFEVTMTSFTAEKRSQLEQARNEPLFGYIVPQGVNDSPADVKYPHVYKAQTSSASDPRMLPENTERIDKPNYSKVKIPAVKQAPTEVKQELVSIGSLDPLGKEVFSPLASFNLIQSIVFDTAYNTNQNILVCAPTGAGKTNIALLSVVRCIKDRCCGTKLFDKNFKIVYIAPMKALASEITANFSKKLKSVGVVVREYTGDMELSKLEVQETQMLVSTPEKWDVITRKPDSDIGLAYQVRLLIIDEVHLLNGDRGPVIESLVARTVRLVESSQQMIRIVGLSATLPNYVDVAKFLKVNPQRGLFFFDQRFRSVPLSQTFIGVKGKTYQKINSDMDEACFEECLHAVSGGHQVMIFVHARNLTTTTANNMRELAQSSGTLKLFQPPPSDGLKEATALMDRCNHRDVRELFHIGFSIHHAGMMRTDRNRIEKYFLKGYIKVLVCTATLAWGVNLPAHTVIIRGTDMMSRGLRQDLDILDVQQIFGRAGRPQFDTSGHGIIITPLAKLDHYLRQMMYQVPIESMFIKFLADNLNAEIVLGTITTVEEAVLWLSYTYLFIRMRRNPHEYGIEFHELNTDEFLIQRRKALIMDAAKKLDSAHLIRFNSNTGTLAATDYGRITSFYYLKYDTISVFNERMQTLMTESEVFYMIAHAQEFEQIKLREEEVEELENLGCEYGHLAIRGFNNTNEDKVCVLLMTYLSRGYVQSSSLNTEMLYICDNAPRLTRALFEIYLRRRNAVMAGRLLMIAQMFQQQQWDFESPLRQFRQLSHEILMKIENQKLSVEKIRDMEVKEIGSLIRNAREAALVKSLAEKVPRLDVEPVMTPITRRVMRICLNIRAAFDWDVRCHGQSQAFWYWIEDPDSNDIYHFEYFTVDKQKGMSKEWFSLFTTIPITEPVPAQYYVRITSDHWLGSQMYEVMTFSNVVLPANLTTYTDLLDLEPLSTSVLKNPRFESIYDFEFFNPIQTQMFHELYYTDSNILLGAPTGSGKTIVAELAMLRLFYNEPERKVVYVAPLKALVRERVDDWKIRLDRKLGYRVAEVTGDYMPDKRFIERSSVIITTPEKWDVISRNWETRAYVQSVGLMIFDEVHLLGEDRGPVLEAIVSRTNFIASKHNKKIRMIGLSTAIANAFDLGNWLDVPESGLFNFRPSVRPVPLEVHIQGFPGKHYCPRMATMNKPAFQAIKEHAPKSPTIIFVSSRRQTRLTASDMITFLVCEENPKQWLSIGNDEIEDIVNNEISDDTLKHTLLFGIGVHHAGLLDNDRKVVEELFLNMKIQVLCATSTLAWGVNFPAHLVVLKGTEYYDGKHKRYVDMPITDVMQMMGRAGRPQYDTTGVAVVFVHDVKKDFYRKFLYEPFPVESHMLDVLPNHLCAEIAAKTIVTKQSACDYITWTYLYRRLVNNPSYYQLMSGDVEDVNQYIVNLIDSTLDTLEQSHCCTVNQNDELEATLGGKIGATYYLSYQTIKFFTETLKSSHSLVEIMKTLCDCYEFNEMPVRHNEDKLNSCMAQHCKIKITDSMDSPHTKTFILLQTHLSRLPMACADYYIDLKLMMDQCNRILQAIMDYSCAQGWIEVAMRTVLVLQMISRGQWYDESEFLQLKHIRYDDLYIFREISQLFSSDPKFSTTTLPELIVQFQRDPHVVYSVLSKYLLDKSQLNETMQSLAKFPLISVRFKIKNEFGDSVELNPDVRIPLTAGQRYQLMVEGRKHVVRNIFETEEKTTSRKMRSSGWFILLENRNETNVPVVMRRATDVKMFCQQFEIITPIRQGTYEYSIYIMSDTFIGLDQEFTFQFEVRRK